MSRKSKGLDGERQLVHMFWSAGWPCIRVAGSGAIKYPAPDIITGNNTRKLCIEAKTSKADRVYINKQGIKELIKFCGLFGAEPWIAVKFQRNDWFFVSITDFDLWSESTNVVISLDWAKQRGLVFSEVIKG